jgi:hypothetical protein
MPHKKQGFHDQLLISQLYTGMKATKGFKCMRNAHLIPRSTRARYSLTGRDQREIGHQRKFEWPLAGIPFRQVGDSLTGSLPIRAVAPHYSQGAGQQQADTSSANGARRNYELKSPVRRSLSVRAVKTDPPGAHSSTAPRRTPRGGRGRAEGTGAAAARSISQWVGVGICAGLPAPARMR